MNIYSSAHEHIFIGKTKNAEKDRDEKNRPNGVVPLGIEPKSKV